MKEDHESQFQSQKSPKTSPSGIRQQNGSSRSDLYDHPVLCRYYSRVLTLRKYLVDKLPASSKTKKRKIASLGKLDALDSRSEKRNPKQDLNAIKRLAELLDSTLVGVLRESNSATDEARKKDFAAFTRSPCQSSTDTSLTCLQPEVMS
jgi:telomerase reverse transcriptase